MKLNEQNMHSLLGEIMKTCINMIMKKYCRELVDAINKLKELNEQNMDSLLWKTTQMRTNLITKKY